MNTMSERPFDPAQPEVICIGQAVVDCITRGQNDPQGGDPGKKPVLLAESIRLGTGGDAVNESFILSQLGHTVDLVCTLGEDLAGNILIQEAARRHVGTGRIFRSPDITTPIANLMVKEDGSRYSINSKATLLEGYTPRKEDVQGARVVSFASLFRAPLDQPRIVRDLILAARDSGSIICADTKLPTFRSASLSDLEDVLPLIDYMFPNEKEAAFYSGRTRYEEMADVFLSFGVKHIIIKTGPEGCYAAGEGRAFSIPARPVRAVDTTGAGDNFVAGFISALLGGKDFRDCCEAGMDQAAICIGHPGAVS